MWRRRTQKSLSRNYADWWSQSTLLASRDSTVMLVSPFQAIPMQIVSVELGRPPSWQRTPPACNQAEMIRSAISGKTTLWLIVDQRYAQHLAQFLDVTPFAQKVQHDARAAQNSKRQREEAAATGGRCLSGAATTASAGTIAATPGNSFRRREARAVMGRRHRLGAAWQEVHRAHGAQGANGDDSEEGKRNHPRSKRKKGTNDVTGVSPAPLLEGQDPLHPQEGDLRPKIPFRGLGGGSFWGSERERRE